MHMYEELKEMLCKELEAITRKSELTAGSLDAVDKLTHSIKSLETIMAMDDYRDDYSNNRYSYDVADDRRLGHSYNRTSYAGRRNARRDNMGRYSRDSVRDDMISELREIMSDTSDEKTRNEFHKFINKLENM